MKPSGLCDDSASFQQQGRQPSQSSSGGSQPTGQRKGGFFLELFAGAQRLTGAVRNTGSAVLRGIDLSNGCHHDLRRRHTPKKIFGSWDSPKAAQA